MRSLGFVPERDLVLSAWYILVCLGQYWGCGILGLHLPTPCWFLAGSWKDRNICCLYLRHKLVVEFGGSRASISRLDKGADMVSHTGCIVQNTTSIVWGCHFALLEEILLVLQMLHQGWSVQGSREVLRVVYLVLAPADRL